jgi:hypothetical protein
MSSTTPRRFSARLPSFLSTLVQTTLVIYFIFSLSLPSSSADLSLDDFSNPSIDRGVQLLPEPDGYGNFPPSGHGDFVPTVAGVNSFATFTFNVNGTFTQGVNLTYPFLTPLNLAPYYALGVFVESCSRTEATGVTCAHLGVSMTDGAGNTGEISTGFGDVAQNTLILIPLTLQPYIDYSNIVEISLIFTAAQNAPKQNLDQLVTLVVKRLSFGLPPSPPPNPSFPPFARRRQERRNKFTRI